MPDVIIHFKNIRNEKKIYYRELHLDKALILKKL